MPDLVLVETHDRVRTITFNRPDARNALNTPLQRASGAALTEADADDAVDVVVLTGSDPAFCAGLDLKELGGTAENLRGVLDDPTGSPFTALARMSKPVIGAINGACVTGGFEVALACDFLVASERAVFADTHARVGLTPGGGMSVNLPQAVGIRKAKELSLTGNYLDAAEAHRLGLVNHVVPHADLLATARARSPPRSPATTRARSGTSSSCTTRAPDSRPARRGGSSNVGSGTGRSTPPRSSGAAPGSWSGAAARPAGSTPVRHVTAPDGTVWTVRRHWLPRAARWPGIAFRNETGRGGAPTDSGIKWLDGLDLVWVPDDGPLGWIVGTAAVILLLVVFFTVVLPVLVLVVDVAVVLVLAAVAVVLRVLLRRPWRVSARAGAGSGAGGSSGGSAATRRSTRWPTRSRAATRSSPSIPPGPSAPASRRLRPSERTLRPGETRTGGGRDGGSLRDAHERRRRAHVEHREGPAAALHDRRRHGARPAAGLDRAAGAHRAGDLGDPAHAATGRDAVPPPRSSPLVDRARLRPPLPRAPDAGREPGRLRRRPRPGDDRSDDTVRPRRVRSGSTPRSTASPTAPRR